MLKKKFLCAAIAAQSFLFAGSASAQEEKPRLSLVLTGGSYHFGDRTFTDEGETRKFNELNPGIGAEFRLNDHFHLSGGVYHNSIYRPSAYGAIGVETGGSRLFGAGIEAGIVSGYDYFKFPVMPMATPYVRVGARDSRVNLKINLIPAAGDIPVVVGGQLRIRLGK